MRILHCTPGNLYGGVEVFHRRLICESRSLGVDLDHEFALCFEAKASEELRSLNIKTHLLGPVSYRKPWSIWKARSKFRELLNERPYDLIVTHQSWMHSLLAPAAARYPIPIVLWIYNEFHPNNWHDRLATRYPPKKILCISHFVAKTVGSYFGNVPLETCYLPVPLPQEADPQKIASATRAEMGIADSDTLLVHISRLEPGKGHRQLIEALSCMKTQKRWKCIIEGTPQRQEEYAYETELKTLVQNRGIEKQVQFLRKSPNVSHLMLAADLLCQANMTPEGFGFVFAEALLRKRPVVTSAIGGALEILSPECGILVPESNPSEFAKALDKLVEDSSYRNRLGENGVLRMKQLFTPDITIPKIADSLRAAAKRNDNALHLPTK